MIFSPGHLETAEQSCRRPGNRDSAAMGVSAPNALLRIRDDSCDAPQELSLGWSELAGPQRKFGAVQVGFLSEDGDDGDSESSASRAQRDTNDGREGSWPYSESDWRDERR